MANPFGMTFEELLKQAGGGQPAQAPETPAPAEENPQTGSTGEMSFEEMVAQAQKAAPAMNPPEGASKAEEVPKAEEPSGSGMSFDELVRQAQAAQNGESPKTEET